MSAIQDPKKGASGSSTNVSEDALIGEMKGGRKLVIALLVIGLIVVGLVIFLIVR
jgi:hypothetical protein